jgi:uncharacterized membrane protein
MKYALWLHLLGVVVWVGGMFFAYMVLRPAAVKLLDPPLRLPLWSQVLTHFFMWVWFSVLLVLLSGLFMVFSIDGFASAPRHIHIMTASGLLMMLIFGHVFYSPFKRLRHFVALKDWPKAGKALNQIRGLVGLNLLLGLITITVATAGAVLL